jgi:NADP-dependent 3-hydroxy acid dehydrogenase YdfG
MPGEMLDKASEELSGFDTVIVNAAVPAEDLAGTEPDQIDYQLAVDFTSWILTAKAAISRMKDGGDLVFIGSMSAVSRKPGSSVYVAAKAGIEGFAQALRQELGERDIKVGLVEPGLTGSDLLYLEHPPELQREMIGKDQMLRAEDIAVAVHFVLTQPRRTNISLVRVESRLKAE